MTSQRVLARYLAASKIQPLVMDKERFTRWIEGVTHRKIKNLTVRMDGPNTAVLVVGFDDNKGPMHVRYEIEFVFSTLSIDSVAMTPTIRSVKQID